MSNNITTQIETVGLSDTNYGSTLNARLGTINDNFDAIVNSNLLKGEPGTSIITEKKSFDSRNQGIYDGRIHRWIAEIICGAQSVDPSGNSYYNPDNYDTTDPSAEVTAVMNNIKNKFIILQYENAPTTDQALVSCIPFVYIDPRTIEAPGKGDTYADLSCTVYYDVAANSFVKEHNFPTLYYDTNSSLFKWRIHGQNTELVAKGPAGADGANGNLLLVKYNPSNYKITHVWRHNSDSLGNYVGSWVQVGTNENGQNTGATDSASKTGDVVLAFPTSGSGNIACVVTTLIVRGEYDWGIAAPADNEVNTLARLTVDNLFNLTLNSLDGIGGDGAVPGLYIPMQRLNGLTIATTQYNGQNVHMIKAGELEGTSIGNDLTIKYAVTIPNKLSTGNGCTAEGDYSHAEGWNTTAEGYYSHAEGFNTTAGGYYSHAEGIGTITNNHAEHACGQYNSSTKDSPNNDGTLFSIGVGTSVNDRKNAFEVTKSGAVLVDGEPVGTQLKNITYQELKQLRTNKKLIPGRFYRITDYICPDPGISHVTCMPTNKAPFDVIVIALSNDKLSEEAWAIHSARDTDNYFTNCRLEAWKLWYCLDNNTSRFGWANTSIGTGVIYRMIDEYGNDCPYDFKHIKFSIPDPKDNSKRVSAWTFSAYGFSQDCSVKFSQSYAIGNVITPCYMITANNGYPEQILNHVIMVSHCVNNRFYNCSDLILYKGENNVICNRSGSRGKPTTFSEYDSSYVYSKNHFFGGPLYAYKLIDENTY